MWCEKVFDEKLLMDVMKFLSKAVNQNPLVCLSLHMSLELILLIISHTIKQIDTPQIQDMVSNRQELFKTR